MEKGSQVGIFDAEFNQLDVRRTDEKRVDHEISKPDNYVNMIEIAEILAKPFPEVRVDLYNENGIVLFGELTFFDGSGYFSFEPDDFDIRMGENGVCLRKIINTS